MDYSYLERNTSELRRQISSSAAECGRNPGDITLLAAVKYATADEVNYLHRRCGISEVGYNRTSQLLEHWDKLEREGLKIHFIGSLQTNKVKYIADKVSLIHSLDSERLAAEIDRQAAKAGRVIDALVEINSGREESKGGVLPEQAESLCFSLAKYPNIALRGFMTMAPICPDSASRRKYFGETYQLIIDIWHEKLHNIERPIISMGMSDSFSEAVAEGSNCVRVGRALFAGRHGDMQK